MRGRSVVLSGGGGVASSSTDNQLFAVPVRSDIGRVHSSMSGPFIMDMKVGVGRGPSLPPSIVLVSM